VAESVGTLGRLGIPEAMRLRDYSSFFRPEEFDALTAAYDAAWQVWTKRLTLPAEQIPVLQKNLTQIILASACSGKRDAEQLRQIALRGVARPSRVARVGQN